MRTRQMATQMVATNRAFDLCNSAMYSEAVLSAARCILRTYT